MTTSYLRSSEPKHDFIFYALLLTISLLVCCSCSSTKQVTQVVEHSSIDTVYLSNLQYDSIYIFESHSSDVVHDTTHIKDKCIEYRYKLLKDTLRIVQCDSIPYEVIITEIREVARAPTLFNKVCRSSFLLLSGALFVLLVKFVFAIKKKIHL